jgi:hypothetical protein
LDRRLIAVVPLLKIASVRTSARAAMIDVSVKACSA